jgi:hypothetical protein
MRASYRKSGGGYRPVIKDDAGKVIWEAAFTCRSRNHNTSRGWSATSLAHLLIEAWQFPERFADFLARCRKVHAHPVTAAQRADTERMNQEAYHWAEEEAKRLRELQPV